jgi:uncharacterized repeat protein (TIGR02543 family)
LLLSPFLSTLLFLSIHDISRGGTPVLKKIIIPLFFVVLTLSSGSSALSTPSLLDFAFHVNGSLYVKSFPANLDASGFDPNTGLGALIMDFRSGPPSSNNFRAFFDHEIQETVNGFDNENGGSFGSPVSGQTWEINEPGYKGGSTYNHFLSGSLGNSNGIPSPSKDDVSMAMGWSFSLQQGEWAKITLVLTQNQGQIPGNTFYMMHTDPESNETVYFYGQIEKGLDLAQYNVASVPSGLQVVVDGNVYTAPQGFDWTPGTTHTLNIVSPQETGVGTRYVFASWSDGGPQSHTVTVPSYGYTCTATFTTQYRLTTSAVPPEGGEVIPTGMGWYGAGQAVPVEARAKPGYRFKSWSGDVTGTEMSMTIAMNGPRSVTAQFEADTPMGVASIPTMGGWAMGLLVLLLGTRAMLMVRRMRRTL